MRIDKAICTNSATTPKEIFQDPEPRFLTSVLVRVLKSRDTLHGGRSADRPETEVTYLPTSQRVALLLRLLRIIAELP